MTSKHPERLIILDTETTGLNPQEGHRIIEIGCLEMKQRKLTKQTFHVYLNPDRLIEEEAIRVHGLTNEFLSDKPHFADIAQNFLDFITGSELVIHNAPFDVGFINYELKRWNKLAGDLSHYCTIFDTLVYARKRYSGQRNSLDALCKRLGIDNSHRQLHGALLDAQILADVFLHLTGGQFSLLHEDDSALQTTKTQASPVFLSLTQPLPVLYADESELAAHEARLNEIEKSSGQCRWLALQA